MTARAPLESPARRGTPGDRRRHAVPLALFVGGLVLTALLAWTMERNARDSTRQDFEQLAGRMSLDVQRRLELPFYGLGGARGALAANGNVVDLGSHARYVASRDLPTEFPGVWGIGYVQRVPRTAMDAWVADVRRTDDPGFVLRTSGDAPDLYVIRFIEPRNGNAAAVGFDIGSEPARRAAAERLWRTGERAVTAPVRLVQDPEGRPGALVMLPVFASGGNAARGPGDPVVGLFYAAITYDLLLGGRTGREPPIYLLLEDLGAPPGQRLLHENHLGALDYPSAFRQSVDFDYHGRLLRLSLSSTPAFERSGETFAPWFILALGLATSALVAHGFHRQQDLRRRAEGLAAGMTAELDRLAMVARLTSDAVVVTDEDDRVSWVNPAFSRLSGVPAQVAIGTRAGDLPGTAASDAATAADVAERLAQGEGFAGTVRRRALDGRCCWSELEVQPIMAADGRRIGAVYIEADVTDRRAQQEALRASRELLDTTGRVAGVGGWRLSLQDGRLEWSEQTCELHGVPPGYAPDVETAIDFYAPEARGVIANAMRRAMDTGEGWDLELPLRTATGQDIWARAVCEVQFEDGRPARLVGAFQDVTAQVNQRRQVDAERRRFAMILDGTDAATWELDIARRRLALNPRMARLIGADPRAWSEVELSAWMDRLHPLDRAPAAAALEAHLAGETPGVACEYRMRHADGSWVWVMCRGRLMSREIGGAADRVFGTCIDITPRKLAELEVAQQRTLLSTTLQSIGDAVLTADEDGRVTWMNPVAETLTGWTSEQAAGRPAREVLALQVDAEGKPAPCPVEACLREQRKIGLATETLLRSRDGGCFVVEDSAAPLRDPDGSLRGVVVIFRDVTEKARLAGEMRHRASHDGLTGLLNRAEFEAIAARALAHATAADRPGAVMFLDLDHFKVVNDACGHAAGDHLLRQVATLIAGSVRSGDSVARFGGDEFAILLEACPLARAEELANRIVDAVDAYRYHAGDGRRFRVGISVGLVPIDGRWAGFSQVMQAADAACYAAKAEGRGRVVVQAALLPSGLSSHEGVKWGPRIEQALDEDLFELHAQRIVPLSGAGDGPQRFEVLLRLPDASGVMASPSLFMPTAERYQLASRIDRWVLRRVVDVLAATPRDAALRASVNLSGQSVGDRAFHRFALDLIENAGLPRGRLCLEITETAAVTNLADASAFIDRLHAVGVEVALDDFGSGTSSFGYLKSLQVDAIKIDGQFVRGMADGGLESVAIRSFVEAARVLGIGIVAEQVETPQVSALLARAGVDYGQGYLFHRPEPLRRLLDVAAPAARRVEDRRVAAGA